MKENEIKYEAPCILSVEKLNGKLLTAGSCIDGDPCWGTDGDG